MALFMDMVGGLEAAARQGKASNGSPMYAVQSVHTEPCDC